MSTLTRKDALKLGSASVLLGCLGTALAPASAQAATTTQQSPINLQNADVGPGSVSRLQFNFAGRTSYGFASVNHGGPRESTMQATPAPSSSEISPTITLNGTSYDLQNIHWHTTSEHLVNSRSFDLEQHMVFKNSQGQSAAVSMFLVGQGNTVNSRNTTYDLFFNNLAAKKNMNGRVTVNNNLDLVPPLGNRFEYTGSLTTNPYTTGIQWIVFANPVVINTALVAEWVRAYPGGNNRAPQRLQSGTLVKYGR